MLDLRRRQFITLLGGAAAANPSAEWPAPRGRQVTVPNKIGAAVPWAPHLDAMSRWV